MMKRRKLSKGKRRQLHCLNRYCQDYLPRPIFTWRFWRGPVAWVLIRRTHIADTAAVGGGSVHIKEEMLGDYHETWISAYRWALKYTRLRVKLNKSPVFEGDYGT
jgi:hypothetical protein